MAILPERLPEALVSRYRTERELGCDGSAAVYLAEGLEHRHPIALRIRERKWVAALGPERFLPEFRSAARLAHLHAPTST
jgi:hypothetical protein